MIVYFVFCIMDSIQGMRLIQIFFFYPLCSVCGPKPCLLSCIQVLHEIRWLFVSGFSVVLITIASEYLNNLHELILTMYPQMSGMIIIPHWGKLWEKRCDFFVATQKVSIKDRKTTFHSNGCQASPKFILQEEHSEDSCSSSRLAAHPWHKSSPTGMG